MKALKIILIAIAIAVGSSIIILGIRLMVINYALENLKEGATKALENNTKASIERMERINQENEERRKLAEIQKEKEKIEEEKWNKEKSKECQFWRLQNKNIPTEKTERKIKEYCGHI